PGASYYQLQSVNHFNDSFLTLVANDFARLSALHDIDLFSTQIRDQTLEYQQEVFEGSPRNPQQARAKTLQLVDSLEQSEAKYATLAQTGKTYTTPAQIKQVNDSISSVNSESLAVLDNTTGKDQKAPEPQEEA